MNKAETIVKEFFEKRGWSVAANGWPDLLVYQWKEKRLRLTAVEVKQGRDKLSEAQKLCHAILGAAGIVVHVIRPDDFENAARKRGGLLFSTETLKRINQRIAAIQSRVEVANDLIEQLKSELSELKASANGALIAFDSWKELETANNSEKEGPFETSCQPFSNAPSESAARCAGGLSAV